VNYNFELIVVLGMLLVEAGALPRFNSLTPAIIAIWGIAEGLVTKDEIIIGSPIVQNDNGDYHCALHDCSAYECECAWRM
jgi:hypothetical protein